MRHSCLPQRATLFDLFSTSPKIRWSKSLQRRIHVQSVSSMSGPNIRPFDHNQTSQDYSSCSQSDLLSRITNLESQLRATQTQLSSLLSRPQSPRPTTPPKKKRGPKPFDPSKSSTRFIALKFAYLGSHYNGFEHANNNVTPKPTVEEVLYKALRKVRLISPELSEGADQGTEVIWAAAERLRRYSAGSAQEIGKKKLELNWDGCEYSKCGRTDRGVSAFGQVIALRVRSKKPLNRTTKQNGTVQAISGEPNGSSDADDSSIPENVPKRTDPEVDRSLPAWDPITSELPYVSLLNSILPPSIRILAWLPHPPPNFSARFSCRERRYKYFFTNPAFCPTPGPMGMALAPDPDKAGRLPPGGKGAKATVREGWLDVDRMRDAAKRLVGLHDYRNLCKIDPSQQMSSCERRIRYADIEEWPAPGTQWTRNEHLNMTGEEEPQTMARSMGIGSFVDEGPKVYTFSVHGSAFLWHQVRCMMGALFLVGQGLEEPSVIDELLDVNKNPGRPLYEMAEDTGLVLWDCVFGDGDDKLDWVYAGDTVGMKALTTKNDGKFGLGGLMDVLWREWRKAKVEEILTGSLVDLALGQGDGSALKRGGFRDPASAQRSQKLFDGGDGPRVQGKYRKVMDKPKMDTLEAQNERYLKTKKVRRDAKKEEVDDSTGCD